MLAKIEEPNKVENTMNSNPLKYCMDIISTRYPNIARAMDNIIIPNIIIPNIDDTKLDLTPNPSIKEVPYSGSSPLVKNIKVRFHIKRERSGELKSFLKTIPYIYVIDSKNIIIDEDSCWLAEDNETLIKIDCWCLIRSNAYRSLKLTKDMPEVTWSNLIKEFFESVVRDYIEFRKYISFAFNVPRSKINKNYSSNLNYGLREYTDRPLRDGDLTYGFYSAETIVPDIKGIYASKLVKEDRLIRMKNAIKTATENDVNILLKIAMGSYIRTSDEIHMIRDVLFDPVDIVIESYNQANSNRLLYVLCESDIIEYNYVKMNFNIPLHAFENYIDNSIVDNALKEINDFIENANCEPVSEILH